MPFCEVTSNVDLELGDKPILSTMYSDDKSVQLENWRWEMAWNSNEVSDFLQVGFSRVEKAQMIEPVRKPWACLI